MEGFFFEIKSCYVELAAGLELVILLPQLSQCWDYRDVPPYLVQRNCFKPSQVIRMGGSGHLLFKGHDE